MFLLLLWVVVRTCVLWCVSRILSDWLVCRLFCLFWCGTLAGIIVIILGIDEFLVEFLAGLLYLLCMCQAGGCLVALSIPYMFWLWSKSLICGLFCSFWCGTQVVIILGMDGFVRGGLNQII